MAAFAGLLVLAATGAAAQRDLTSDRTALMALYDATDGPNWKRSTGWSATATVTDIWHGVGIGRPPSSTGDRVVRLAIGSNGLDGELPDAIGDLDGLANLNLRQNALSGDIPVQIGNLVNLGNLLLHDNQLSGPIPDEIGNLVQLSRLHLERNRLSGAIPVQIGNLVKLQHLNIERNQLSGAIPDEIGNLVKLKTLTLGFNRLSGAIPDEIGNLVNLTYLGLPRNRLSGEIPEETGRLVNLTHLVLDRNRLTGGIPEELGKLATLTDLDVSENQLRGPIPEEMGRLANLKNLFLYRNRLSGPIPPAVGHGLTSLTGLLADPDTGLCLPADFPMDSNFGVLASRIGIPACGVLSVDATLACGAAVTDTSATLSHALVLTPAPRAEMATEYRRVTESTEGEWLPATPIAANGHSVRTSFGTFAQLRQAYDGFAGFDFRLRDRPSVTARCTWQFDGAGTTPAVSLSAAPNPVTEGSPVTVTARLSSAVSHRVTIPLTVTRNTSEEGDHGTLAAITINGGATTGAGSISTAEDADTDDERFTVALGALPASVTAGRPSSVRVTIRDGGGRGGTPSGGGGSAGGGRTANRAPAVSLSCEFPAGGESRLTAFGSDPDGDPLTFAWNASQGRFVGAADGAAVRWRPARTGQATLRVTVSDGWDGTASATCDIEVTNAPPAFGEASYRFEIRENEDGRRRPVLLGGVAANDPDGDAVTYSLAWGDGGRFAVGAGDGVVTYVGVGEDYETEPNRYELAVRALDPHGGEARVRVVVVVTNVNEPPVAVGTIPDQALDEGGGATAVDVGPYFHDVDGDPLTYRASSSDPVVATVSVAGAVMTLTPVEYGSAVVTVTAEDPGGLTAEQTFLVGVSDRLVRWVVSEALAGMARSHLASARMTLGRRVAAGRGQESRLTVLGRPVPLGKGEARAAAEAMLSSWLSRAVPRGAGKIGARSGLAGFGGDAAGSRGSAAAFRTADAGAGLWPSLVASPDPLRGSEFVLALGGGPQGGEGEPRRGWRVWGQGDAQAFQGAPSALFDYDGSLLTGYLGVDRGLAERWLAGVALSRSQGAGDWRVGGSRGSLTTRLTAAHPYVQWSDGKTSVWATGGGGVGSARNERQSGRTGESGLDLGLGLLEVRRRWTGAGLEFSVRADGAWAQLRTGSGEETVDRQRAAVYQARVGVEVSVEAVRLGPVTLAPLGEVHLRGDGGTGEQGAGVELVGGTRAAAGRLRLDALGRLLVVHSAAGYRERGVGVTLGVVSRNQTGLSLSVSPRWGDAATGAGALWQERVYRRQLPGATGDAWALEARGEYGVRLPSGGRLTWFGSLSGSAYGKRVLIGGRVGGADRVRPPGR